MSQWTHFLGVIRFESLNLNSYPEPPEKQKIAINEVHFIHRYMQGGEPSGSEGPLQVETILTKRGPTVVLTGDLRDFGKSDLNGVVEWVNEKIKQIAKSASQTGLAVRDAFIDCNVEYHDKKYIIEEIEDPIKHDYPYPFVLNEYKRVKK